MKNLSVTLNFLEPWRVLEWHERKDRNTGRFMRGGSFARWHNSNDSGRPYITGTLVRTAFLKAAEEYLWLHSDIPCCAGEFKGSDARVVKGMKAKRLRRRQTLKWTAALPSPCIKDTTQPCPLCLLLGRCDQASAADTHFDGSGAHFDVRFSNFDVARTGTVAIEDLAAARIVNRVDTEDGKAEDFIQIWEIDPAVCGEVSGQIHLSARAAASDGLRALIEKSAAFVDRIAGALCYVEIHAGAPPTASTGALPAPQAPSISTWAQDIKAAFEAADKIVHLRLFADVLREMRRESAELLKRLPKGHRERRARQDGADVIYSPHFIWDEIEVKGASLRSWLPQTYSESQLPWPVFCGCLGQAVYEQAKEAGPEQFPAPRPVGAAEGFHLTADPQTELEKSAGAHSLHEILITGQLTAQTPFFFGWEGNAGIASRQSQTSMRLLLTPNGCFRLPRSVLRGILRRDLKAVLGTGCRSELGHRSPCACPVCQLMRRITVRDGRSTISLAPQIRHRIRLDAASSTVAAGALFDMEVGPRGVTFPLELRLRTPHADIPRALETVLHGWAQGRAFLSGGAGTGKGRFQLDGLKCQSWNLKSEFDDYRSHLGGRKEPLEVLPEWTPSSDAPGEWEAQPITLRITTPFITRDPIASMLTRPFTGEADETGDETGSDAVCYRSVYVDAQGQAQTEYLLKGESLRGLLRTVIGRRKNLLTAKHDDCTCLLCQLFGSEHKAGQVRVEDLRITSAAVKRIDRVAIDRFTGGAKDKHKFDFLPLLASPDQPLVLEGQLWQHRNLSAEADEALKLALKDIRSGRYPLGGLGNIGWGWVDYEPGKTPPTTLLQSFPLLSSLNPSARLHSERIYWPHYFLPFGPAVQREKTPPSHAHLKTEFFTGKLCCTLKTLTPLIIPDSENVRPDAACPGHQHYGFFTLDGVCCIPGSGLRGMISSVYEALTNSCLRIFEEKKRLSWRMEAKNLDKWKPGRVVVVNGALQVEEMEEARLPVYDNPKLMQDIKEIAKQGYYHEKQPTRTDSLINDNAESIRQKLADGKIHLEKGEIQNGFRCYPHGKDSLMLLKKPKTKCNQNKSSGVSKGLVHFTGPNKLEITKLPDTPAASTIQGSIPAEPLEVIHNTVSLDTAMVNSSTQGSVERSRAIPKYEVTHDNYVYTMNKRCERVFLPLSGKPVLRPVSPAVANKFRQLCDEYEKNAVNTPPVFRTRLPENGQLNPNNTIYFCCDEGDRINDIIPVRISRKVDDKLLAERLSDDRRPCVREILDDTQAQKIKKEGLKSVYQHHPDGLCPACALFGTGFYKSRIAFGLAFPVAEKPVQMLNQGQTVTLPLLERPRPTWSMPAGAEADSKVQVPGRKLYVHHQGWRRVLEQSEAPEAAQRTPKTENNRSVTAVDAGQEFHFEVRFENLRDWELGLLLHALNLETELAHKLGMGKALGFGSVAIQVSRIDSDTAISTDALRQAAEKKFKALWGSQTDSPAKLRQLLHYVSDPAITVQYPSLKQDDADNRELPGYMELKDQDAFQSANRQERLNAPWSEWYSRKPEGDSPL